ncbi:CU044_5270 family protein [Streptomyces millisiae]|uniref:CU044_5270 family protein n=1 Tax=Streptomyces millisiae TaxID=3075542 RepID=A0ABU2LZ92_9ACTN|nr:CU044_5270 family protein [Streptomyces sp. DSM 44918]MDT0322889.1 CU044_5270 family protein [Streptomyces sp. DSM 44918]
MTRQEPPSREELANLLPSPGEPGLPPGRRLALEEHLMSEITGSHEQRPLWRRRLVVVAAPLATAALVVGAATVVGTGDGGSAVQPAATSGALNRLAQVAAAAPEVEVAADQFVYTAREVTVDFGGAPTNGQNVIHDVDHGPYETEQWVSPDGGSGWYWDSDAAPDGVPIMVPPDLDDVDVESLPDPEYDMETGEGTTDDLVEPPPQGRHYEGYYPFGVGGDEPADLRSPSWDYVQSLPVDPDVLLEKIYEENGSADSEDQADQSAFETIGGLFEQTPLPPDVAAAGFRAFGEIPGVTVGTGTDAVDREGIVLSRFSADLGYRVDLVFDEESARYLGTRVEQVEESEVKPTGVVLDSAVTERAVVDEERQVPGA